MSSIHLAHAVPAAASSAPPLVPRPSVVVFASVESLQGPVRRSPGPKDRHRHRWTHDAALVLLGPGGPSEMLALHEAFGIREPFICEDGGLLYIPAGYYPELRRIGWQRNGWNVLEFKAPHEPMPAVRLLRSLYRMSDSGVQFLGLAAGASDYPWLRELDLPVLVKCDLGNQDGLLDRLPAARVTTAAGYAGWHEAVAWLIH